MDGSPPVKLAETHVITRIGEKIACVPFGAEATETAALRARRLPGQRLLIFDNAPGHGPVRAFVPPTGTGQVLVTSQSAVWAAGPGGADIRCS